MKKLIYVFMLLLFAVSACKKENNEEPPIIVEEEVEEPFDKDMKYSLPLAIHLLYSTTNPENQSVTKEQINNIVDKVNKYYKGYIDSEDINLEFYVDTINYVNYNELPKDSEAFLTDKDVMDFLCDPNDYINICFLPFEDYTTGGISYMGITSRGDYELEGTSLTNYTSLTLEKLGTPYCVAINSLNINSIGYISDEGFDDPKFSYISNDVVVNLTHELGHYLGLRHNFVDSDRVMLNSDNDIDFCADTELYNREEYEEYLVDYVSKISAITFDHYKVLIQRTELNADTIFVANNIMDYMLTMPYKFTADQKKRIRHLLNYGTFLPGERADMSDAKAKSAEFAPEGTEIVNLIIAK